MCLRSTTSWVHHRGRRLNLKTPNPGEVRIHHSSLNAGNRLSLPMVSSESSVIDWFRRGPNVFKARELRSELNQPGNLCVWNLEMIFWTEQGVGPTGFVPTGATGSAAEGTTPRIYGIFGRASETRGSQPLTNPLHFLSYGLLGP